MNLYMLIFYLSLEKPEKGPRVPPPWYYCFTDVMITEKECLMCHDEYTCKFPFTYQGKEYDTCVDLHLRESCGGQKCPTSFCAIEAQGDDGHECPSCWKNETYKIGYCTDKFGGGRCHNASHTPGKSGSNGN